jgi:hypothetical protein
MLHMEYGKVTKMIDWLESIYGEMRVSRGKVHEYLGMTFNLETHGGGVKVTMIYYLKGAIRDFSENIAGSAATPIGDQLFEVRPNASK